MKKSLPRKTPLLKNTLARAVFRQDIPMLKKLLDQGSNVNLPDYGGWVPAMVAAREGHLEAMTLLLNAGADVHIKNRNGWTSAMIAAQNGSLQCLALLISVGSDLSVQSVHGETALSLALEQKYDECIDMIRATLEFERLKKSLESVTNPTTTQQLRTLRV